MSEARFDFTLRPSARFTLYATIEGENVQVLPFLRELSSVNQGYPAAMEHPAHVRVATTLGAVRDKAGKPPGFRVWLEAHAGMEALLSRLRATVEAAHANAPID